VRLGPSWTQLEDSKLRLAVERYGRNWALVAGLLRRESPMLRHERTETDCRLRFIALEGWHEALPRPAGAGGSPTSGGLPSAFARPPCGRFLPRPNRSTNSKQSHAANALQLLRLAPESVRRRLVELGEQQALLGVSGLSANVVAQVVDGRGATGEGISIAHSPYGLGSGAPALPLVDVPFDDPAGNSIARRVPRYIGPSGVYVHVTEAMANRPRPSLLPGGGAVAGDGGGGASVPPEEPHPSHLDAASKAAPLPAAGGDGAEAAGEAFVSPARIIDFRKAAARRKKEEQLALQKKRRQEEEERRAAHVQQLKQRQLQAKQDQLRARAQRAQQAEAKASQAATGGGTAAAVPRAGQGGPPPIAPKKA
jgi:hypothetical protein